MTAPSPASSPSAQTPDEAPTTPTAADVVRHVDSLDARIRYAREIAAAGTLLPRGVLDGIPRGDVHAIAGRVFLIAETGNMLGIHPVAALQGVNVIEGKPTLAPALMGALVRRAGHKFRVTTRGKLADGTLEAVATVTRNDDPEPFTSTWDLDRAERAGLVEVITENGRTRVRSRSQGGKAKPWEAYTEAMLKARATGEVCRDAAEEVLMGVHYTPEELGAVVGEDGEVLETLQPEPEPPAAPVYAPAELGQLIADRLTGATTVDELGKGWREAGGLVERQPWAQDYANLRDYAERTQVTVDDTQVDLYTHVGNLGRALKNRPEDGHGGGQGGPGGPQGDGGPSDPPPAPQEGTQPEGHTEATTYGPATDEVVDAEVVDDPAPYRAQHYGGSANRPAVTVSEGIDPDDPWANGGAGVAQPPADPPAPSAPSPEVPAGVPAVAAGLGGEVLDVEGGTATETAHARAEAEHYAREEAARQAAAERAQEAATDQGHGPAQTEGTSAGRAAYERAKAELRGRANTPEENR